MKVIHTNLAAPTEVQNAKLDQLLIAVTADCLLSNSQTTLKLPDVAVLWFTEALARACKNIWVNHSELESFRDFYGEYQVTVRFSSDKEAAFMIETADSSFTDIVHPIDIVTLIDITLSAVCESLPECADSGGFRLLKESLLKIAAEII